MTTTKHSGSFVQDFILLATKSLSPTEATYLLGYSCATCPQCIYFDTQRKKVWITMSYGSDAAQLASFREHCGHRLAPNRLEALDAAIAVLKLGGSDV